MSCILAAFIGWCVIGILSMRFWWRARFGDDDNWMPFIFVCWLGPIWWVFGWLENGEPSGRNFWGRKIQLILAMLLLSSCVSFQSGDVKITGLGGKGAWSKGNEMFTYDNEASFVAAVTGIQNLIMGLASAWIAGDVAKVREYSNQLANAGLTKVQIATLNNKFKLAALAQKPTVIDATQKAVFPPIK